MKRRMTRRRAALCWTALAVALTLLWGLAKGYGFTPGQARRKMRKTMGMEDMELVVNCDWEEHRYTQVVGGPDRERYLLFAGGERMYLARESFELLGDGWRTYAMTWRNFDTESAVKVGDLTFWLGNWFPYMDTGYLYFRVDGDTTGVAGFSVTRKLPDGSFGAEKTAEIDHGFGSRRGAEVGRLGREELARDGKNHAYGAFLYYVKEIEDRDQEWYLQVEWIDGSVERAPFPGLKGSAVYKQNSEEAGT